MQVYQIPTSNLLILLFVLFKFKNPYFLQQLLLIYDHPLEEIYSEDQIDQKLSPSIPIYGCSKVLLR